MAPGGRYSNGGTFHAVCGTRTTRSHSKSTKTEDSDQPPWSEAASGDEDEEYQSTTYRSTNAERQRGAERCKRTRTAPVRYVADHPPSLKPQRLQQQQQTHEMVEVDDCTSPESEGDNDEDDLPHLPHLARRGVTTRNKTRDFDESPRTRKRDVSSADSAFDQDESAFTERAASVEICEEAKISPSPYKRRLRSGLRGEKQSSSSVRTENLSGNLTENLAENRTVGRRYPERPNRLPPGSLAYDTHAARTADLSDLTSADSDADSPPKKKTKRVPGANVGASSSAAVRDNSGTFEPNIYFPVKAVSFETVGGYTSIKEELRRSVVAPFRQRMKVMAMNQRDGTSQPLVDMTRGALFWGPPGTGKTLMAKALAYECGKDLERCLPVYIISGAELLTKWVGESESRLREIFNHASENSPSIIFMDELDGLVRRRTSSDNDSVNFNMVSTLLTLLNGAIDRGTVLAIATTNFKEVLDPALLRSGRLDLKIHFPSPTESERSLILQALTQSWSCKLDIPHAYTLARNTSGFTGADLDLLCKKARNMASQRLTEPTSTSTTDSDHSHFDPQPTVLLSDFFAAWQEVEPSGHSTAALPYEPLTPLLQPLLKPHLKRLYEEVVGSFSVRVGSAAVNTSPLSTLAWAAFSQPGLLLDYDPVLFIYTQDDALMLDAVVQALFHLLSERNKVKAVDVRSAVMERSLGDVLGGASRGGDVLGGSGVVGLLRLEQVLVPGVEGKCEPLEVVFDVLQRRDKLRCPLLVITSTQPLKVYGKRFKKVLGPRCKKYELTAVDQSDCADFFKDIFMNEAVRTAREDGQMVEIAEGGLRDRNKTQLATLARLLEGRSVETVLSVHQRLSHALNADRYSTIKENFLEELKDVLEEFGDDHMNRESSSEESGKEADSE